MAERCDTCDEYIDDCECDEDFFLGDDEDVIKCPLCGTAVDDVGDLEGGICWGCIDDTDEARGHPLSRLRGEVHRVRVRQGRR